MRPILFYLGSIPVHSYGVMLFIAFGVGLLRTLRAARRTNMKPEQVSDVAYYSLLCGVASAYLVSILLEPPIYIRHPELMLDTFKHLLSPDGGIRGLSFHGGLAGAVLAALIYTRKKKLSFIQVLDLFAPGIALGYSIARIGCFLNGCCYGIPTSLPWGVRFHVDEVSSQLTVPSHPTQIYASIASLVIFFLLVRLERTRRFAGQVFFSYLAMYSVYRFLIEFLRKGVTAEVLYAGLTQAQFASIAILVISLIVLKRLQRHAPSTEDRESEAVAELRESARAVGRQ